MTTVDRKTIRDLVSEYPQATDLLERFKIDYRGGVDRPLEDACARAGVGVDQLLSMLQQKRPVETEQAFDPATSSLTGLINYIMESHHAYANREMAELPGLFERVLSAYGNNHPELLQAEAIFSILCDELKPHMFMEEQTLFPYLLNMDKSVVETPGPRLPSGTVSTPISLMNEEHDAAGDLLRDLREVTSNYHTPPDAGPSHRSLYERLEAFDRDLHRHIDLENDVLFRRAIELEAGPNQ